MKMINSLPMFLLAANLAFPALAQSPGASCSPDGQNLTMKSGTLYGAHLICAGGVWSIAGLQVGNATDTCAAGTAGVIRWNGSTFQGCDGAAWVQLVSSTSKPTYMGTTPSTYTGNLGGIIGANNKCSAAFPGSRFMKASEAVYFYSGIIDSGWVLGDVHNGSDGSGGAGGCYGYVSNTNSNGAEKGMMMTANGGLSFAGCDYPLKIHCVKD
jgi:hypothetical protein